MQPISSFPVFFNSGHRKLGLPAADAGLPDHNRHRRCAHRRRRGGGHSGADEPRVTRNRPLWPRAAASAPSQARGVKKPKHASGDSTAPALIGRASRPRAAAQSRRNPHPAPHTRNNASSVLARQEQRRQLRIVDGAATVQCCCPRVRAITREAFPQFGQPCVCTALFNQPHQADTAMSVAASI